MSTATLDMPHTTRQGPSATPAPVPLTRLRVGQSAIVQADGFEDAAAGAADRGGSSVGEASGGAMLRAMGLTPDAKIRLCRLGEPCIVAVRCACGGQTRIGLARRVASRIMVQVVG